jgi:hypothetical protein
MQRLPFVDDVLDLGSKRNEWYIYVGVARDAHAISFGTAFVVWFFL